MKGRNLIAFLLVLLLAAGLLPRTAFAEEEMKTLPAAETEETESLSAVPTETESESQSDLIRTDRRLESAAALVCVHGIVCGLLRNGRIYQT